MSNMLQFLNKIYSALDQDPKLDVFGFYAGFSKAFDRVTHKLLLEKLNYIDVKGCFLEILYDYLHKRKQFFGFGFTAN